MGFLRERMKKLEGGLILGFHSVAFTKNVTLKKQRTVLGKNRQQKHLYSCTSVLEHLGAAAEQAEVWWLKIHTSFGLKKRAGVSRRMLLCPLGDGRNLPWSSQQLVNHLEVIWGFERRNRFWEMGYGIRLSSRNFNVSLIYRSNNTSQLPRPGFQGLGGLVFPCCFCQVQGNESSQIH